MHCPQCRAENLDEASFCLKCGAKLHVVCPQCGVALPAEAMFCFKCGARIGPSAAMPPPPPSPASLTKSATPRCVLVSSRRRSTPDCWHKPEGPFSPRLRLEEVKDE